MNNLVTWWNIGRDGFFNKDCEHIPLSKMFMLLSIPLSIFERGSLLIIRFRMGDVVSQTSAKSNAFIEIETHRVTLTWEAYVAK